MIRDTCKMINGYYPFKYGYPKSKLRYYRIMRLLATENFIKGKLLKNKPKMEVLKALYLLYLINK